MNPVNQEGNKYCGPAVISIITGLTTNEAAKKIQGLRGNKRSVTGTWIDELVKVLNKLGYYTCYDRRLAGHSLFFTLTQLQDGGSTYSYAIGYYLIATATHFVLIEKTPDNKYLFCDNHTKKPINACSSARLSERVVQVVYVRPK